MDSETPIADRVRRIISAEWAMEDMPTDSLVRLELAMLLEEEFGVDIPDQDVARWEAVSQVVAYIEGVYQVSNQIIEMPSEPASVRSRTLTIRCTLTLEVEWPDDYADPFFAIEANGTRRTPG